MPKARMVLAAVTYLVTRRTSQRLFRFPPGDPVVKQIFEYALAYAAGETGVRTQWEGTMSKPEDMGQRVLRVQRPDCASARTKLPEHVEMKVHVPPSLQHWTRRELMEMLRGELKRIPRPRNPIGMKRIREQGIWERPKTSARKSAVNPHIAGDTARRTAMIALLKAFRADYQSALEKYCDGEDCVFPEGTWKMRLSFGVKVVGCTDPP